jgi:hypothetical protein
LIDTQLLNILQQTSIVGKYINPFSGAAVVFMEGIFSAAIISLGVMQYLKTSKLQQIEDDEKRYKTVIPQASPQ